MDGEVQNPREKMLRQMRDISRENREESGQQETPEESFRRVLIMTRILLAVFLVCGVIFLDRTDGKIGPFDSQKIFRMMELDYGQVVTERMAELFFSASQAPR